MQNGWRTVTMVLGIDDRLNGTLWLAAIFITGGGGADIFITTPNGFVRQLNFAADGSVTAPGSDFPIDAVTQGEDTVVNLNRGEEVYRVKDIVILGD